MGKKYDFEYLVIGSGPAGGTAALELAKAGKRVCLVEGRYFGGSNINTRDIPYLAASDFAHTYARLLNFPELGHQDVLFNLPTVPARINKIATLMNRKKCDELEAAGVVCVKGFAHFLDEHTVAIDGGQITAETLIIATGAELKTGGISNLEHVGCLTPDTAMRIVRLPKVMAVIGGGATGAEIAEYYAELGVKVIIFEAGGYFLPREDRETSDTMTEYFSKKLGITVLSSCRVVAIEEDEFSKCVIFRYQNTEKMVRVDCVVLATGSSPVVDCGLENAKVEYTNNGIVVDKFFATSTKNIYAIGDCLGKESSTDRAINEGARLALNLINKTKNALDYHGMIRSIKTYPEVATVGYTENDLLQRDRKYQKALVRLKETPAGMIYGFNDGFIKMLADRSGHLLGATIVAPNAEMMMSALALALRHNLTMLEIASTPHISNAYSYLIKLAAREIYDKQKKSHETDTKIIKIRKTPSELKKLAKQAQTVKNRKNTKK